MAKDYGSLQGKLLLDGGRLKGSYFSRTVILICQHNSDGALGLVLNHDSGKILEEAVVAELPERLKQLSVYIGGPVQPSALSYIYTDTFIPDANVMTNVQLGHSLESLIELGGSYSSSQEVRVFAGYAGWSSGQLEQELEADSWLIHPASIELIFNTDTDSLWSGILREKGLKYRLLAEEPEDLSLN